MTAAALAMGAITFTVMDMKVAWDEPRQHQHKDEGESNEHHEGLTAAS